MSALDSPAVSVIVATCNGARGLPRLLDALASQVLEPPISFEVLIVDNRSTDETASIVRGHAERAGSNVRYLFEGCPGKSCALNAGVQESRAPLLAFTDDDGIPAPDWIRTVADLFESHPELDCIGGRVELFDPADAELAVRRSMQWQTVDMGNFDESNIPIIGCNMAIRSAALRSIGTFDTALGPGSVVGVAEDADILYRLLRAGKRLAYAPNLLVHHNHGRRTRMEIRRSHDGYLLGRGGYYAKYALRRDMHVVRHAYWEVSSLLKSLLAHRWSSSEAAESRRALSLLGRGALRYLRHGGSGVRPAPVGPAR